MVKEREIYAKEQQVKMINIIMNSLCVLELSSNGRKFLKKLREKLKEEITDLQQHDLSRISFTETNGATSFSRRIKDSVRFPWR